MNQNQMMAQVRKMQADMAKAQEELASTVVSGIAAGGLATVEMTCDYHVKAIKLARGCADCSYNRHHAALDFDHRDRAEKHRTVSWLVSHNSPWSTLMAEIDKCDVVCANCHRIRSFDRRDWTALAPVAAEAGQ